MSCCGTYVLPLDDDAVGLASCRRRTLGASKVLELAYCTDTLDACGGKTVAGFGGGGLVTGLARRKQESSFYPHKRLTDHCPSLCRSQMCHALG